MCCLPDVRERRSFLQEKQIDSIAISLHWRRRRLFVKCIWQPAAHQVAGRPNFQGFISCWKTNTNSWWLISRGELSHRQLLAAFGRPPIKLAAFPRGSSVASIRDWKGAIMKMHSLKNPIIVVSIGVGVLLLCDAVLYQHLISLSMGLYSLLPLQQIAISNKKVAIFTDE